VEKVSKEIAGTPEKPPEGMVRPSYNVRTWGQGQPGEDYLKLPQGVKASTILQKKFENAGNVGTAHMPTGARLHDYYETAKIVDSLPNATERINFVNPYEREWTRAERRWHREWLPRLRAQRKAWALKPVPQYFDVLDFYKYLTKTRVVDDETEMNKHYESIVLPTSNFEKRVTESLLALVRSDENVTDKEKLSAFLRSMVEDSQISLSHTREALRRDRVSHTARCESFWIRGGFSETVYQSQPVWAKEVLKKGNFSKSFKRFTGDDSRKLGELAFTMRDEHAVQIRSRDPLKPIFPLSDTEELTMPFADKEPQEYLLSPIVYNIWPDKNVLWQCPGYEPDTGETHMYGRLAAKEMSALTSLCQHWQCNEDEEEEVRKEVYTATAVSSLFNWLNGQAHCLGHTQYTDIREPLVSQLILSDGKEFFFAIGQLNTIAINMELREFVNEKNNVCYVDGPYNLYDNFEDGVFTHSDEMGAAVEGLNKHVLSRFLQMIVR
jgi:predicted RNA binding protein with dsRBD fold (UPF0201 family)